MSRGWDRVKRFIVNLKLDLCCWLAPVRVGLFLVGYFNVIYAVVALMGIADDSFQPLVVQVQMTLMPDTSKKPVPIVAYCTELAFNSFLIAALHRMDIALLRVYMRYNIATIITSILVYSLVVATIGAITAITMVLSILFQFYVVLLIRSIIVEIRLANKRLQLPTLVMSTPIDPEKSEKEYVAIDNVPVIENVSVEVDVEAPEEHAEENRPDSRPDSKLETVDEHPKEETNEK